MDIAQTHPLDTVAAPWHRDEFEQHLRAKGKAYHIHHPFNVRMNSGGCAACSAPGCAGCAKAAANAAPPPNGSVV